MARYFKNKKVLCENSHKLECEYTSCCYCHFKSKLLQVKSYLIAHCMIIVFRYFDTKDHFLVYQTVKENIRHKFL